jgi:excisionase family DNA binding protein
MEQRFMTVQEAAKYLGTTEGSIRNRVQRRSIPFLKDGKRVRFDRFQLDKHMKQCELVRMKESA